MLIAELNIHFTMWNFYAYALLLLCLLLYEKKSHCNGPFLVETEILNTLAAQRPGGQLINEGKNYLVVSFIQV